jgi:hypothetical protein
MPDSEKWSLQGPADSPDAAAAAPAVMTGAARSDQRTMDMRCTPPEMPAE